MFWSSGKGDVNLCTSRNALFEGFLGDKVPIFKGIESEEFLIIGTPDVTLKHDVINADIDGHVRKIMLNTRVKPAPRMKQFFAVVTGVGRGKTRTLVEIMRYIKKDHLGALCLPITFNSH